MSSGGFDNAQGVMRGVLNVLPVFERRLLRVGVVDVLDGSGGRGYEQYDVELMDGNLGELVFYPRFCGLKLDGSFDSFGLRIGRWFNVWAMGEFGKYVMRDVMGFENVGDSSYFNFKVYLSLYFNPVELGSMRFSMGNLYMRDGMISYVGGGMFSGDMFGVYGFGGGVRSDEVSIHSYLDDEPDIYFDIVLLREIKSVGVFSVVASHRCVVPKRIV